MKWLSALLVIAALVGKAAAQETRAAPQSGTLNLIPGMVAEDPPTIPAPTEDLAPVAAATPGPHGPMLLVGNPDDFQVPETAILGPVGPVKFGKLISLNIKPLVNRPKGLFSVTYVWRLHPMPDDLVVIGNTQAMFGSGTDPATVNVELIACYLFIDKDKTGKPLIAQRVVVVDRDIVIGGGSPVPVPDPVNPVNPVVPDSPLGLTKLAYSWMTSVNQPDPTTKKTEAKALAKSFRGIASTIVAAVDYTSPEGMVYKLDEAGKVLRATKSSNNAAIPQSIPQWTPWFVALDGKLKELKAAGKVASTSDYAAAWNELAAGLEAVAK